MSTARKLAAAFALALAIPASAVFAHSTGHESRAAADCEKLPGTAERGERAQCLRCMQRPKKMHYHPDYPRGKRCRPDNGKP